MLTVKKIRDTFCGPYRNQILATLIVNTISFSHGIALGWMSPTLLVLSQDKNPESPLEYPLTVTEASWVGSLISLGALIGNAIFGISIDLIGKKKSLILVGIPHICFWILVYFGNNVLHLYCARLLAGTAGGGVWIITPIFVAEISDNKIRGTLVSLFILFMNCGLVVGFIITSYLPYTVVPIVVITIPIVYIVLVTFLPDTPQYLIKNGNEIGAENSLKFYTNYSGSSKNEYVDFNLHFTKLKTSILVSDKNMPKKINLKDYYSSTSIKAICIGICLMIINQFTGGFAIINYATKIFHTSGSDIDPNLSTIIIGINQIAGSYISTILVDRYGRKILLIISIFSMALGLTACGVNSYIQENTSMMGLTWIPVTSISFFVFVGALGVNSLTFVVLTEILPTKIRAMATMLCYLLLSIFAFIALKTFPILLDQLELFGVMFVCASFCILGLIFITIFVPETKGKDLMQQE